MTIASRVREHIEKASWIRRMFEEGNRLKAEHGADQVADLSLGNPEIEPPEVLLDALERAAADRTPGLHRYMPNAGYPETREAVARCYGEDAGLPVRGADVVMVCGAAAGLNVVLKSILDPGDEVIILAPYFPEYTFYIDNHGGVPRPVPTRDDFTPDIEAIEAALTERTRAVIVNSPNNPTGVTYSAESIASIAALLTRRAPQCYLISDEPYRRLIFDGAAFAGILGAYPRSIVVGSHSKDLAIPGERIGAVVFSPEIPDAERAELVGAATFVNRTLGFVNAPALMQRVVRDLQGVSVAPSVYQERRDVLCDGLRAAGFDFVRPGGAFYLFLRSPIPDDVELVRQLAEKLVLTVPGSGFGTPGYIRISYCVRMEQIERALPRFAAVAVEHGLERRDGRR